MVVPLRNGWQDARLEGVSGRWRDELTGREIDLDARGLVRDAVDSAAGAVLVRKPESPRLPRTGPGV